ncbi:MAG: phage portal protein [Zoogloeaceae bacterium]|jgi:lambda family phage portal protein|nr:phage portal protein [Zoogloeaceae bacterium]
MKFISFFRVLARKFLPGRTSVKAQSDYDAAGNGRRTLGWRVSASGPTAAAVSGLAALRNRSRAATRNNPIAAAAIDRLVSNLIGTGITPRPRGKDASLREALQFLWEDWTGEADADGVTDFYGLQALVCRTMLEAGECFIRLRPRRPSDGLAVPLQLQALEPEFVPYEKNGTNGANTIRAGIEFNPIGRRVAYWIHPRHPNDDAAGRGANLPIRVPADQVLHVFEPLRPGQIRGIPVLAPALTKLKSLDDFDDAALFRQQVANLFAGFIRKPAPEERIDPITGGLPEYDRDGFTPMTGLEPGTMQELLPGEEVEFSDPPDAGNAYPAFMRQQLQAVAAGAGIPYEILTGDLREVSDRAIRVVLNEFHRRIEERQFSFFIPQFCRPVRAAWLDSAVLSGAIALPDYHRRRGEYLRTRWAPQGWAYIHPVQDVEAQALRVKAGFASRSEVVLREGYDAELIDEENAADHERERRLGLVYSDQKTED